MRTCNQLAAEEAIRFRKMCMLPPLETLVVTIVGSTELDGILSVTIPNRLLRRLGKFTEHRYKLRGVVK